MNEQTRRPRIAAEETLSRVAQAGSPERNECYCFIGSVVKYQSGFLGCSAAEFARAGSIFDVPAEKMNQRKVGFDPFDIVTTRWSARIQARRVNTIAERCR